MRKTKLLFCLLLITVLWAFSSAWYVKPWPSDGNWVLDTTIEQVECYHQITECNGRNVVLLKFINRNSSPVSISWKEMFVTKQVTEKKESAFGKKQLLLPVGETAQNDCSLIKQKACIIRSSDVSPTYNADIQEFYFKDISVVAAD